MQPPRFHLALLPLCLTGSFAHAADHATELDTVYVTAEKQLQQSLGVSRISKKDLDRTPPSTTLPTSCAPCRA